MATVTRGASLVNYNSGWADPANALGDAADGAVASAPAGVASQSMELKFDGIPVQELPDDAVIASARVVVRAGTSTGDWQDATLSAHVVAVPGGSRGVNGSITGPTADRTVALNASLTVAELRDGSLVVALARSANATGAASAEVDFARLEVDWAPNRGPTAGPGGYGPTAGQRAAAMRSR